MTIATAIRDAKADYLLAVKANQPSLRAEIERQKEAMDLHADYVGNRLQANGTAIAGRDYLPVTS